MVCGGVVFEEVFDVMVDVIEKNCLWVGLVILNVVEESGDEKEFEVEVSDGEEEELDVLKCEGEFEEVEVVGVDIEEDGGVFVDFDLWK